MFMRFVSVIFFGVLLAFSAGCDLVEDIVFSDGEDNPWVGEWEIVTIDGYSLAAAFETEDDAYSVVWFDDDGTWEGFADAWFTEDGISVEISIAFYGTYELSDSRFTLAVGSGEGIITDGTGQWELEGDTLTLLFDDGTIIVLQPTWSWDWFDDEYPETAPQSDAQAMTGASQ